MSNLHNFPGFSADGEQLSSIPLPGEPFRPLLQPDLHKPIEVTGVLKKKIMKWFPSMNPNVTVYMWSKFSDFSWNPNDYVQFENDDVSLHFIISSCGVLYFIADAIADTEEVVKVKEILGQFKKQCCKKDKNCPKKHYFIGSGQLKVNGKKYEGIHIYVEPDYNPEQVYSEVIYNDTLYEKYHRKHLKKEQKEEIISTYIEQLEKTVDESFNSPFPLGKKEFNRK